MTPARAPFPPARQVSTAFLLVPVIPLPVLVSLSSPAGSVQTSSSQVGFWLTHVHSLTNTFRLVPLHTRVHAHTCSPVHTHTCPHTHTSSHSAHSHTCSHMCLLMPSHTHTYSHPCTHIDMLTPVHTRPLAHIPSQTCAGLHLLTYVYTFTHVQFPCAELCPNVAVAFYPSGSPPGGIVVLHSSSCWMPNPQPATKGSVNVNFKNSDCTMAGCRAISEACSLLESNVPGKEQIS